MLSHSWSNDWMIWGYPHGKPQQARGDLMESHENPGILQADLPQDRSGLLSFQIQQLTSSTTK